MAKQTVALYTVTSGDRVERARTSLSEALEGAQLGDPDDTGAFEVSVDAESPEAARELVREAFARAGTGDDFVIRETTEGREMAADDPRQAGADEAVAAAAADAGAADTGDGAGGGEDRAGQVADAAESVRAAASDATASAREAIDEKGVAGAASDYARDAAQTDAWRRFAPIAGLLLLLAIVRRRRRRY